MIVERAVAPARHAQLRRFLLGALLASAPVEGTPAVVVVVGAAETLAIAERD